MANRKPNPFAQDFQSIKESADDAVMQFLKHGQQKETPKEKVTPKIVEISASPDPESVIVKSEEIAEIEAVEEKAERKNRSRAERSERNSNTKERVSATPKEWGRPTALFNTRIPQEMSDLLDDLVYRLKKEGKPHTKQTIAIEALDAYLQKSGLITKNAINLEGSVYPTA